MRTFKTPTPPPTEVLLDRKMINHPDIRVIAVINAINELVNTRDWRYHEVGPVTYHDHSILTKSDKHPIPYEVIPVLNLGYLESRVIEQSPPRETDLLIGFVRVAGIVQKRAVRKDKIGDMTRIVYDVVSIDGDKSIGYIVTDTYIEVDCEPLEFSFTSKMV